MTTHHGHHAVEVILTRPATHGELHHACRRVPLAVSADRTRLMVVHSARSPGRALHVLRRRLGTRLPVDVLSTHYPDRRGQVLLNVDLGVAVHEALRRDAAALGQRPQDLLRQRLRAALAHDARERARLLEDRIESLLAHHTPDEVLVGVAGYALRRHHRRTASGS